MIELPEALTLAAQMRSALPGKTVRRVFPPSKPHKFCWFSGDPADYEKRIAGRAITGAEGFGLFAELLLEDGQHLSVQDGVNVRYLTAPAAPGAYQLFIEFTDETALLFTVAMYGGIMLHGEDTENEYYRKSREAVSPFSEAFPAHFARVLSQSKPTLSAKAFLATEQRFPGIGNGALQDILFSARIHPKRKLASLTSRETDALLESTVSVLRQMTDQGGRDTEKDLFGQPGGYATILSRNTAASGCPHCGGPITKEAYLGGSVYYCPACQKLS